MKKILAFLLAFSLVFGIAACSSGPKPEDSVKKFCEAAKAFDFAAMAACCDESFDPNEIINTEEEDLTGLMNYLKMWVFDMRKGPHFCDPLSSV